MAKLPDMMNKVTDRLSGIGSKFNSAIIVAAGSGLRASTGKRTKQLVTLLGKPVIARTVSIFESCKFIDEIIIVAKEDELPLYDIMKTKYRWKKIKAVVKGGQTRQESVLEGFKSISDESEFVYIHDGARCLVTEKMIVDVGRAACLYGAAFASQNASDTVRIEGDDGRLSTLDRSKIRLAQTPQVFKTELYRASAYYALKDGFVTTDDIALAEHAGFKTVSVDCGRMNIKITEPQDFSIAEAILKYRSESENNKNKKRKEKKK